MQRRVVEPPVRYVSPSSRAVEVRAQEQRHKSLLREQFTCVGQEPLAEICADNYPHAVNAAVAVHFVGRNHLDRSRLNVALPLRRRMLRSSGDYEGYLVVMMIVRAALQRRLRRRWQAVYRATEQRGVS